MPKLRLTCAGLGALFVLCLQVVPAVAQQRFSYVSLSGTDVNSCSSPAVPCTFQRAHDRTLPGGTVFVVDSGAGASNQLTITKSISIVAVGVTQYLADGGNSPIIIDAGPNDVVLLDGVRVKSFPGYSPSAYGGIRFIGGGQLHVRNCVVEGFGRGAGIHIVGPGPSRIEISDCVLSNNRDGLWVQPAGSPDIIVLVDRVTLSGNKRDGIRAQNQKARVRINASTITNNGTGLNALNGGSLISHGNNVIRDNDSNGAPTATQPLR
ncbi:MAG: hypothetical protein GEU91_21390 [Rhizobiales bacterium]|nr:hypothetical protein [Hyphomicrobiales bacterium]